jgi:hypothetical protein
MHILSQVPIEMRLIDEELSRSEGMMMTRSRTWTSYDAASYTQTSLRHQVRPTSHENVHLQVRRRIEKVEASDWSWEKLSSDGAHQTVVEVDLYRLVSPEPGGPVGFLPPGQVTHGGIVRLCHHLMPKC